MPKSSQFTYDFGINLSAANIAKVTRLGVAVTALAGAFYALNQTSKEYVTTLKQNALRLGGILNTMKEMNLAQERLVKGESPFTMKDQIAAQNILLNAGIKTRKEFERWEKFAHATGQSVSKAADAYYQGIHGNLQGLVQMGVMTQRATKQFERFRQNPIMMKSALDEFMATNKHVSNVIKQDFDTIQDMMTRLKGTWQLFLQSIMGNPKDPNSWYAQTVGALKYIADAFSRNMKSIKAYGKSLGMLLGWAFKNLVKLFVWVGGQVKRFLTWLFGSYDDMEGRTRSLIVKLDFLKFKILKFLKEYRKEIGWVLGIVAGAYAIGKLGTIFSTLGQILWGLLIPIRLVVGAFTGAWGMIAFLIKGVPLLGAKLITLAWYIKNVGFLLKYYLVTSKFGAALTAIGNGFMFVVGKVALLSTAIAGKLMLALRGLSAWFVGFRAASVATMVGGVTKAVGYLAAAVRGVGLALKFVGRAIPIIGWLLLAIEAVYELYKATTKHQEAVRVKESKEFAMGNVKVEKRPSPLTYSPGGMRITDYKKPKDVDLAKENVVGGNINLYKKTSDVSTKGNSTPMNEGTTIQNLTINTPNTIDDTKKLLKEVDKHLADKERKIKIR